MKNIVSKNDILTQLNNININEHHHHSQTKVYGSLSGSLSIDTPVKHTVTGGSDAWGTENLLTSGGTMDGVYFDLNTLFVVSVSAANKISVVEFLSSTLDTEVTGVAVSNAGDSFTKVGHGLVNGDKITITNLATATGLDSVTVYHVINMLDNTWQLSLTNGGAAVVIGTGDGTCSFKKMLSQTTVTKTVVSMAGVTSDSVPISMNSPRTPSANTLSVRAKSETGSTVAIGYLIGLHTYTV